MHSCPLLLAWLLMVPVCARAGGIELPSDISISLSAEPSSNLQSGQTVTFTMSATNHGPEPIDRVSFRSSPIYDELDIAGGSVIYCDGDVSVAVADTGDSFYYLIFWYATLPELAPIPAGETRTCQISMDYTEWAPPVFPFTFAMRSFVDANPANDSATVYLRGAVAATPVPALSAGWLALLLALMACIGTAAWQARTLERGDPRGMGRGNS